MGACRDGRLPPTSLFALPYQFDRWRINCVEAVKLLLYVFQLEVVKKTFLKLDVYFLLI